MKEFDKVVRRRSGTFNPNESAPPRPTDLGRPHSVYRMENSNPNNRQSDPEVSNKAGEDRRRSDFLTRYEELTCKAALAIKSVDQIVSAERKSDQLDSPLTPDIEFNEEHVLKTCHDFLYDYKCSKNSLINSHETTNGGSISTPIPAPRLSLINKNEYNPPLVNQLSQEDEQLLVAAQGKRFWENKNECVFDKVDNVATEVFDSKIIRTRSSSLTLHDKRFQEEENKPKPILKKSIEDVAEINRFPSILKTRDDFGFQRNNNRIEHVRIQSPSIDRKENVRIRSPSPDFDTEDLSNGHQLDDQEFSPEVTSILKNRYRSSSADNSYGYLDNEDGPQSILVKRKTSFGSVSHSPEGFVEGTAKSILKKSSRSSSRTCSRSGSTEELDFESTKSILKSRNSSRTCSRSGSQEELDLDFDGEWESKPRSILKKKPGSTDDELDERPKSILKLRQSEESLNSNSDLIDGTCHSILRDRRSSSGTRQSSVISDPEDNFITANESLVICDHESPFDENARAVPLKPILRSREDQPPSILKNRDKSKELQSPCFSSSQGDQAIFGEEHQRFHLPFGEVGTDPTDNVARTLHDNGGPSFRGDFEFGEDLESSSENPHHQHIWTRRHSRGVANLGRSDTNGDIAEAENLNLFYEDTAGDGIHQDRNLLYRSLSNGPGVSDRPPQGNTESSLSRRRGKGSAQTRFQTQPITVDEVEQAKRQIDWLRPRSPSPLTSRNVLREGVQLASQSLHSVSSSDSPSAPDVRLVRTLPPTHPSISNSWQEQLNSSPVRASPAQVIPSESSPEDSPRSFYFRPVSQSPTKSRLSSRRSNSSPPYSRSFNPSSNLHSPPPPPCTRSPTFHRSLSSPSPSGLELCFRPVSPEPLATSCLPLTPDSPSKSSSNEDFHYGILKNKEDKGTSRLFQYSGSATRGEQKTPTKSILKEEVTDDSQTVTRGVLKKDSSYEARPSEVLHSSSSSSEDVTRTFSDVIIDPVPGQGRRSAPETPAKKGNSFLRHQRPLLPSASRISADGNLASKLAQLSGEADTVNQKMTEENTIKNQRLFIKSSSMDCESPASNSTGPQAGQRSVSPEPLVDSQEVFNKSSPNNCVDIINPGNQQPNINPVDLPPIAPCAGLQRKSSRGAADLPAAADFYQIYQQQKRRSSVTDSLQGSEGSITSLSPSPTVDEFSGFQRCGLERRSLRQRSVSPKCRSKVDFWESEQTRSSSQERSPERESIMPERSGSLRVKGGGIMDRLASLQKHGEEEWKKKVNKSNPKDQIIGKVIPKSSSTSSDEKESVTLRVNKNTERPVSMVDRLSKLNSAQNEWQKKVGQKDTDKFTVAGKMEREKIIRNIPNSDKKTPSVNEYNPVINVTPSDKVPSRNKELNNDLLRRTPKKLAFKSSSETTPTSRPVSCPVEPPSTLNHPSPFARAGSIRKAALQKQSNNIKREPISSKIVPVPEHDSELLEEFFSKDKAATKPSENHNVTTSDFDCLTTEPLLVSKRTIVKPKRTKQSKNPVKALGNRDDLQETYTEFNFGVAEREAKENQNKLDASKHSHLAAEARAGLASTEDFTQVELRRGVAVPHKNMQPYRDKMLIQVKGRRFCQSRIVPPVSESLNSGDCFLLVSPTEVFCWQGKFSNVIERSRSAEVAQTILTKKDLGCKGASKVELIEEEKLTGYSRENRKFWMTLTGKEEVGHVAEAGLAEEDEEYEQAVVEASTVYEVDLVKEELVPLEEGWGVTPNHNLLHPDKVLVFDFGSEVYSYNGKNAGFETRRLGARLCQELWSAGWDYSECMVNPGVGGRREMLVVKTRPSWTVVGRINHNMETILFREKFVDWPDMTRVIGKRIGGDNKELLEVDPVNMEVTWSWADLEGVGGDELTDLEETEPDMELEGSHLGRGRGYYDLEERRNYEISTMTVTAWYVNESDSQSLGDDWSGHFHTEDTYIVRWKYKVALTGRALKGGSSKHDAVGRERCVYFFWHGSDSKVGLQGASALQTVELDSEKGPQLRVREGREHATFLSLWGGNMVVFKGKRLEAGNRRWRLFIVRGEDNQETFLKEVECRVDSLRSRGVLLLVGKGKLSVWVGCLAQPHQVEMGMTRAKLWRDEPPQEFGGQRVTSVEKVEAGQETSEFWEAVGSSSATLRSLSKDDSKLKASPRLYHMTSVLGKFEVIEITPDFRKIGVINSLLFDQTTLYDAEQPALFMFDCGSTLYLWQGWTPVCSPTELDSNTTGSGYVRWHAERRAAMQTLLDYSKVKYRGSEPDAVLVWAGHETRTFINMFPHWLENKEVADINKECVSSPDLLSCFTALSRKEYTWQELQERPLPPGVDAACIETYLSNTAFQEKFQITKEEYKASPRWKQIKMKQEVGLF